MNMYQPALDAYQHGADQSLAAMFKLASQPTPAATFMDSLQAREQTDFNRGQSERQSYLRELEAERRRKHEDYLFDKLKTEDQNKDEDRSATMARHEDNLGFKYDKLDTDTGVAGQKIGLGYAQMEASVAAKKADQEQRKAEALQRMGYQKESLASAAASRSLRAQALALQARTRDLAEEKFAWAKQTTSVPAAQFASTYGAAYKAAIEAGKTPDEAEDVASEHTNSMVAALTAQRGQTAKPVTSAPASNIPEGTRSKAKDGTPVIRRGGKWVEDRP